MESAPTFGTVGFGPTPRNWTSTTRSFKDISVCAASCSFPAISGNDSCSKPSNVRLTTASPQPKVSVALRPMAFLGSKM